MLALSGNGLSRQKRRWAFWLIGSRCQLACVLQSLRLARRLSTRCGDRGEDSFENARGGGWTAGNRDIDRDHVRDTPAGGVTLAEEAAGAAAVAECHDELRV